MTESINKGYVFKLANGEPAIITDTEKFKRLVSLNYNFILHKEDGVFLRWGKTKEDDGDLELGLPEIADIEISTVCHGPGKPCAFCYKGNTGVGDNMSLETFKKVFANLPPSVTQIAFGIGDIDANKDMKAIFEHAKNNGIKPNVTVNGWGITDEWAKWLAETCGAVAVSLYDKEHTYDTIAKLHKYGLKQVNIHFMISNETLPKLKDLIVDVKNKDPRLKGLNAIVLLSLKQKGRGVPFTRLSQESFNEICDEFRKENLPMGFDSCSAGKVITWAKERGLFNDFKDMIEPCESTIYSSYINEKGMFFPCSFMEGELGWETGIDVANCKDFLKDVWYARSTGRFREKVIDARKRCEGCNHYTI